MKANFKSILTLLVIIAIVLVAVSVFAGGRQTAEDISYSQLKQLFENNLIKSFEIDGNLKMSIDALAVKEDENGNFQTNDDGFVIELDDKGEPKHKEYVYQVSYSFQLEDINRMAQENKESFADDSILETYNYDAAADQPWYEVYLPYIILTVIFIVLWIFVIRQTGGAMGKMNSFSKSKAKVSYNDKDPVKFADVAGADEEKAELEEVVEFLKDPQKFTKLGARIPRGVLLVGPPGTGKTLLAKAVAGEAGVPFFSISGSDFVEMYVGVGASRVRDLFENARRTPASIIFIDEIDAVGRHRGAGLGGGHDEREQTLNQLLVEMDGFGTHSGVIVMAATNRPDILDPALLRPGRFDRRVTVNNPDMKGREDILRVHSRNKPMEATVDFAKIAQSTIGFTGADLANLLNEAAILAAKRNKALIGMDEIEDSYMKMILGPQKKVNRRTPEDNKLCAYHEAGHAVAGFFCEHADPVKHITIVPAGNAGGVTINPPVQDRMTMSKKQMIDEIVLSLGGRVAEALVLDDISTGASSDIQQATSIARNMVKRYGMSDVLGPILYASERSESEVFLGRDFSNGTQYSSKTAAAIDDEVHAIISSAYERCKQILSERIDKLHFVAQFLLKNESMDGEQFKAAMTEEAPTMEMIEDIAFRKKQISEDENKTAHENNAKAEAEAKAREEEIARRMAEDVKAKPRSKDDEMIDDFLNNFFREPSRKEEPKTEEPKKEEPKAESDNSEESQKDQKDDDSWRW